ncbi:oligosaccharide repeat unit polymerase [Palleronia sediminis]|uniref:Oligosaccharide repeat unit polymerase n=1 Tax=Palleronia sediminis TaxID=2547833 RepID=A0A4R6AAT4_9RHOB|nr:O-antigen polymerase [Palleronia sediminis]TDL79864.1 oligosaccharide repeat unit polymerase [Palleronia sediminis]
MSAALSPLALLAICWGATFGGAALWLAFPDRFDLVPLLLERQGIDPDSYAGLGLLWLAVAGLAWIAGDLAHRGFGRVPGPPTAAAPPGDSLAGATLCAAILCLAVTLCWIATAAMAVGPGQFARLALADPLAARAHLLSYKLFPGMRLFYAALPGPGCLAVMLLARGGLSPRARTRCRATVVLVTLALLILPVVMSQRLLLLQFVLSAWLAASLVRGRVVGRSGLLAGAMLFLGVWIAREAITNPSFDRGAFDIGIQKLVFYCANDLWNALAPLGREVAPTLGMVSFRGVAVFAFLDAPLADVLGPRLDALETMRGGGDFALPTAAFLDFGLAGGAALIAGWGWIFRAAFVRAGDGPGWTVLYAQLGAALLFSSHGVYATHQNLIATLLLVAAVLWVATPRGRAAYV